MSIDLSGDVRGISIKQPWLDAIVLGPKRVENRPRGWPPGTYLLHGSRKWDRAGESDPYVLTWFRPWMYPAELERSVIEPVHHRDRFLTGAVTAVAEFIGCHPEVDACCRPWGQTWTHHLGIGTVWLLPEPVPCKGALGPWKPPADVLAAVCAQLAKAPT